MKIFILETIGLKFPKKINDIILTALKHVNREKYFYLFKDNIEVLPLIMNLTNAVAKHYYGGVYSSEWYGYKHILLKFLAKNHDRLWYNGEVVFFETPYGQISAHVFDKAAKMVKKYGMSPKAEHRYWYGNHLQPKALKLIDEYIEDALGG